MPVDKACYTCHTDYAIYGPLRDKLRGLWNISIQYLSTPPKTIHIPGGYNNQECLQCHAGTRDFEDNLNRMAPIALLTTNKVSCISCHNLMHNVSQVDHMKMWSGGAVLTSVVFGVSSPASATTKPGATAGPSKAASATTPAASGSSSVPAKAKPGATTGASKAPTGSSSATTAQGKSVFDSHHCSGCHGASGGGGSGPALTHISSQYPPAKLTALLKAPTAKMKAAGMVPLTLNAADMKALVSYVTSLGGKSAASAATPPASGSSSPAPAKAKPGATAGASKAVSVTAPAAAGASSQVTIPLELHISISAAAPAASGSSPAPAEAKAGAAAGPSKPAGSPSPAPAEAKPGATGGASKAPTGSSSATATRGKSIFDAQRCSGCHGASGGGGSGPALTHISSQYPPAKLTALLKAPTAKMKAAGMVPLTLNAADMKGLVSYVTGLGGKSPASAATSPAPGSSSPAPSKTKPSATGGSTMNKLASKGKLIFNAHGCANCHGTGGVAGTAAAPALAGTGKNVAPALLTKMLQHPTARMQQGGMPPVSLGGDELKALVAYVAYISASESNHP